MARVGDGGWDVSHVAPGLHPVLCWERVVRVVVPVVDVVLSDYAVHTLRQIWNCWGYVVIPSGFDNESLSHSQFLRPRNSVVPRCGTHGTGGEVRDARV